MRGKKIFEKTVWTRMEILRYHREKLLHEFKPRKRVLTRRRCSVKAEFFIWGWRERYDLDNLIKQLLDLLVDAMIISDDRMVFNIEATMREVYPSEPERFTVKIYRWDEKTE